MTKLEIEKKKAAARKRVTELDRVDGYKDRSLGTIIVALESGISMPGNTHGAEWDALVMLEELRSKELPVGGRFPRSFKN